MITDDHKADTNTVDHRLTSDRSQMIEMITDDHKGISDSELIYLSVNLIGAGVPPETVENHIRRFRSPKDASAIMTCIRDKAQSKVQEVREFITSAPGVFYSQDVQSHVGAKNRREKMTITNILSRLRDEGMIERSGERRGCFRRVEHECLDIDWIGNTEKELPIYYPLGLERYYMTYPKNLVVIAGSPDAGKTSVLLNFVRLNMDRHKIHYFSSEMGSMELKSRLVNFDLPITSWKFSAKERAGDFADIIQPDDINVIDFLEISDNFYKIGGILTAIFNKLRKGIAVIAMQKNRGAEMGRGGNFGLEKPRLYITLDSEYPGHVAKIVKCKNWRDPTINPNGLSTRFKLIGGAKIVTCTDWKREIKT